MGYAPRANSSYFDGRENPSAIMNVKFEGVTKTFFSGKETVTALDNVHLEIGEGQFVVVRGPSGSGKTTFLQILGGMLRPSCGRVWMGESDLYAMSVKDRARFRARNIGFVFQMFHLIPYLTVEENVMAAAGSESRLTIRQEARNLLDQFGMGDRIHHRPSQLSAGEKQRTAIARALITQPRMILADEPTGNLDPENAREVLDLLSKYHRQGGIVVLVTHGPFVDARAGRIFDIRQGRLEEQPVPAFLLA